MQGHVHCGEDLFDHVSTSFSIFRVIVIVQMDEECTREVCLTMYTDRSYI